MEYNRKINGNSLEAKLKKQGLLDEFIQQAGTLREIKEWLKANDIESSHATISILQTKLRTNLLHDNGEREVFKCVLQRLNAIDKKVNAIYDHLVMEERD